MKFNNWANCLMRRIDCVLKTQKRKKSSLAPHFYAPEMMKSIWKWSGVTNKCAYTKKKCQHNSIKKASAAHFRLFKSLDSPSLSSSFVICCLLLFLIAQSFKNQVHELYVIKIIEFARTSFIVLACFFFVGSTTFTWLLQWFRIVLVSLLVEN